MSKATVAIVRTRPETVLDDTIAAFDLGGGAEALDPTRTTILKDNISWHYPFLSANTTPWQLEGTILALRRAGFDRITCVQNKTEVTKAEMGEALNRYTPIFEAHGIEVRFNFRESDMSWVPYEPKARMHVLHKIYDEGLRIPDYFIGRNRFGPTKFLQRRLTEPPMLHVGNAYSRIYHDVLHWPLVERRIYQRWLRDSAWGHLFERYGRAGALRP